jgi:hypothetical protein
MEAMARGTTKPIDKNKPSARMAGNFDILWISAIPPFSADARFIKYVSFRAAE